VAGRVADEGEDTRRAYVLVAGRNFSPSVQITFAIAPKWCPTPLKVFYFKNCSLRHPREARVLSERRARSIIRSPRRSEIAYRVLQNRHPSSNEGIGAADVECQFRSPMESKHRRHLHSRVASRLTSPPVANESHCGITSRVHFLSGRYRFVRKRVDVCSHGDSGSLMTAFREAVPTLTLAIRMRK
jgi:hypothetical protein